MIAVLKGRISDDGKKIYILTMTTKPIYKKNGAMSHLIGVLPDSESGRHFAEFGIVFLMFSIGLEFSLPVFCLI